MRKRRKKNNNISIIALLFIIILLSVSGYLIYTKSNKNLNNTTDNKITGNKKTDNNKREVDKPDEKTTTTETNTTTEATNNTENNYTYKTQDGNDVTIKANKSVTATGFSGASNHKFYLRDKTLYYRNTSTDDNAEEIIAENVKDLYIEDKEVIAELYPDGKIIKENNYVTYKK